MQGKSNIQLVMCMVLARKNNFQQNQQRTLNCTQNVTLHITSTLEKVGGLLGFRSSIVNMLSIFSLVNFAPVVGDLEQRKLHY